MSLRKPDSRQLTFAYEDQYQLFQVYNITCSAGTVCMRKPNLVVTHDDVIKWKHFPRYWPFVRGIHRSPVNSPHKGQWRDIRCFFFHLRLNKRLSKLWWDWWFETPSRSLWRHYNALAISRHSNLLWPNDTIWRHIYGTKPLLEPMLTYHQGIHPRAIAQNVLMNSVRMCVLILHI